MRYWYHAEERNSVGKIDEGRLRALIRSEQVEADVLVWRVGMEDWTPACEVLDLRAVPPAPPPVQKKSGEEQEVHAKANVPRSIPESCERCDHFTRVNVVNPARGHCAFYDVERYADNACYAHVLSGADEEKAPTSAGVSLDAGAWMYLDGEAPRGPLRRETVQEMLEAGALAADTFLWTEGLSGWRPAHQLGAFNGGALRPEGAAEHASLPAAAAHGDQGTAGSRTVGDGVSQKRPWVRYFARTIDGLLTGFGIGFAAALIYPPLLELGGAPMGLLILFLFVFIEAFLLTNWGTTPGKSLFRISVLSKDGGFLSYAAALQRSFGVWLKGMGAGVPIVSLFALGFSYHKFKEEGTTSWDQRAGSVVVHRKMGADRVVVVVVVALILFGLLFYGQQA